MVVANWMRSHRIVWWVSNRAMLHSADIPVSHRAPMKPSGHWHWNAPSTFIHVPPFWHGLLFLLAHLSMSAKKTQVDAWSVSLLWCIFLKSLIANLLPGKEATAVSTQTSHRNICRERILFPFPVLLLSLHFRIYSQAFTFACLTIFFSFYSKCQPLVTVLCPFPRCWYLIVSFFFGWGGGGG